MRPIYYYILLFEEENLGALRTFLKTLSNVWTCLQIGRRKILLVSNVWYRDTEHKRDNTIRYIKFYIHGYNGSLISVTNLDLESVILSLRWY
jgi:hypothetical protein